MEEERLEWEGKPSQLVNVGAFAGCIVLAWMILPIAVGVRRFLDTHFTSYRLTNERFERTSGILSRRVEQIELYRVKDLSIEQPLVLRLSGRGNLVLRTSDKSCPVLEVLGIAEPELLRDRIRGLVEKRREHKQVRELDI